MSYKITEYTKQQADKLGVVVKPSTNKSKKLDVFKNGEKVASVGAIQNGVPMGDYPTYLKTNGKEFADERRRLFNKRFEKQSKVKNSNAYFAKNLLW